MRGISERASSFYENEPPLIRFGKADGYRICIQALEDKQLYDDIIEHRRTFYALKYADYDKLKRDTIDFYPPSSVLNEWRNDYEQMTHDFIYGDHLSFEDLLDRIKVLRDRFRG